MLWKVQAGGGGAVRGSCLIAGRRSCRFQVVVVRRAELRLGERGERKLADADGTSGIV